MDTAVIPPLPHRGSSISVQIAAHFERLIATGELAIGSKLPSERELAQSFGISRSTLREAMFELEAKRLVKRTPGRGTIVQPHLSDASLFATLDGDDPSQTQHAAELRTIIEPSLAALAARRATAANLLQLRSALARTHPHLSAAESLAVDMEFHLLLAQAAGNPLLRSLHTLATEWTADVRTRSHATRAGRRVSRDGHLAIFTAVENHDEEGARAAMEAHLLDVSHLIASHDK